jgi:FkbM family methyltransferase
MRMPLLPALPGMGRLSKFLSNIENRFQTRPVFAVRMRSGHCMYLDRRSNTECKAFYTGVYEELAINVIKNLMQRGASFVDVGANIGFFAVALGMYATSNGFEVVAFEPVSTNIARLKENIELNGLQQSIRVFDCGLSSAETEALITLREDFAEGAGTGNAAILINDGKDNNFRTEKIRLRTFDAVCEEGNINPSVIKVDIEGHEDEFFAGAKRTIELCRPIIFMEVNNYFYRRKGASLEASIAYLRNSGYRAVSNDRWGAILDDLDAIDTLQNVWLVPSDRIQTVRELLRA